MLTLCVFVTYFKKLLKKFKIFIFCSNEFFNIIYYCHFKNLLIQLYSKAVPQFWGFISVDG